MRRRELLAGLVGVTSGVLLGTNATAAPANALSQPLTDVLLNPVPSAAGPVTAAGVRAAITAARADHQACRYAELATRLPGLIRNATAVRQQAGDNETCAAEALLADAYGLAAHLAIRLREDGLAWICLDRGLRAARASGDPLIAADTQRWSAIVLRRSAQHRDRAQQVVITAADQLGEQTGLSTPEHASTFAALRATAAYTAAIHNDRATALDLIGEAEHACRRQSPGTQSRTSRQSIGFGHLDLATYKIGVARKLGDFGTAIDHARAIRPELITSPERRVRYWEDTALALHDRGRPAEALRALLAAERVAPQEVRHLPWARDLTTSLLAGPNRGRQTELRNLASRVGVH